MASAASRATGLPAITYNAAGLHARTVPYMQGNQIDAVSLKGDALTWLQRHLPMPKAAADKVWELDPGTKTTSLAEKMPILKNGLYHMGGYIKKAIGEKIESLESLLNGGN
ncbi:hypothetical protein NCH01_20460 [Neoasaia chiangmaiensis]|nr:hypothetical protein NCH01_20460 [Neoasaia chiangmaiensis]